MCQNSPSDYMHFLFFWGCSPFSASLVPIFKCIYGSRGTSLFTFVSFYKSILLLFAHKMGSMFPIVFSQHLLQSEFSIWNMGHQDCKQYSRRGFFSVSHSAINSCKSPLDIPSLLSISHDFVDVFHGLIILAVLYDVVIYWKPEGSSSTLPILASIEETSSRHKIKALIHILPKWAQYFGPFKSLQRGLAVSWETLPETQ